MFGTAQRRKRYDKRLKVAAARVVPSGEMRAVDLAKELGAKVVALPRVVPGTRAMRWFSVDSLEGLERSPFGVEEPPADAAREVFPAVLPLALALVPGLAFDAAGFRLGYGGGFYDTFLADFPGTTVGLCRTCQLSAVPLPRGPYDLPVGLVVTEDGDILFSEPALLSR